MQWYGCLGRHPRTQTIFYGIVHFKHHHPRYPKTPLLACRVQWYGCLVRHPRTQTMFYGIVHFKHHHPKYPKTLLLACRVQLYGCLGTCVSNTTILGTQKHLCWPMMCRGMGGWSATPESKQYFLASCVSNTPLLGIQKHLFWPMVRAGMGGWKATPESTQYFLVRGVTAHLGYSGLHYGYFQVCFTCERTLRACTPERKKKKKKRIHTIFFGIVCFKHTHSRYPKIPSLAHGVQRYGWLERHLRIQAMFFGIVFFKHIHSRYPKIFFLL